MQVKKLVLDYSKWRSGDDGPNKVGVGQTMLLNEQGSQCCIGQWCEQLGIPLENLKNVGEPSDLGLGVPYFNFEDSFAEYGGERHYYTTTLAVDCIGINDTIATTPEEKIEQLTERLKKEGIELEVINKP